MAGRLSYYQPTPQDSGCDGQPLFFDGCPGIKMDGVRARARGDSFTKATIVDDGMGLPPRFFILGSYDRQLDRGLTRLGDLWVGCVSCMLPGADFGTTVLAAGTACYGIRDPCADGVPLVAHLPIYI
jgi:hypothetical protein